MSSRAFISHISEESAVAARLKSMLNRDFLGLLDVFVSSDTESIAAGAAWLDHIDRALRDSALFMVLCSGTSISRPWINFEAGAAWMRKIPIIPLCHEQLLPRDLPMPLSTRQGVSLNDAQGLERLYSQIAKVLKCQLPQKSYEKVVHELTAIPAQTVDSDTVIMRRLDEALSHPKHKWRAIGKLAAVAGVSEELAATLLRADSRVRFSKSKKSGGIIAGLRSRVDAD